MAMNIYSIHLICGGEFSERSDLSVSEYTKRLEDKNRYYDFVDFGSGADVIIAKDQIEYIEVIKLNEKNQM